MSSFCPRCGGEFTGTRFCTNCGLDRLATPPRACTACGGEVVKGDRFCQHCGAEQDVPGDHTPFPAPIAPLGEYDELPLRAPIAPAPEPATEPATEPARESAPGAVPEAAPGPAAERTPAPASEPSSEQGAGATQAWDPGDDEQSRDYEPGSGARGRTGLVLALLLIPLLLLLAGGTYLLWPTGGGDPAKPVATSEATPTSTGSPETSPSTIPSTAQPAGFRCWDGTKKSTRKACGLPTGLTGLKWVFPSFDPSRCRDRTTHARVPQRAQLWDCRVRTRGGQRARIRYSEWAPGKYADQLAHYTEKFAAGSRLEITDESGPVRYLWRTTAPDDGVFELSSMWAGLRWSLSVDAASPSARDAAFEQLVRFRPASRLAGEAATR